MGATGVKTGGRAKMPVLHRPPKAPARTVMESLTGHDLLLLEKYLTEPVEFVPNTEFAKRGIERTLFGGEAKLAHPKATSFGVTLSLFDELNVAGDRLPTLTAEQERFLFTRYNFARMKICRILDQFANKMLTAKATRELLAWGRRALETRAVIVRLNMPLVLAMAKRTRLTNIDFNEMISEGNMALLRSVDKFDCTRGFKFSTYSCRAILKSFSRVAMRASRYRGYFPTEFDPAMERSDFTERQRESVERDCVDELKDILLQNLAGLSQVEQTVITERFAIGQVALVDSRSPKTLEQVGQIIGVTKERVRQIQNAALKKIKVALENGYLAA